MDRVEVERIAEQIIAAGIERIPEPPIPHAMDDAPLDMITELPGTLSVHVLTAFDEPDRCLDAAVTLFAGNVNIFRRRLGLSREEAIARQVAVVRATVEEVCTPGHGCAWDD